MNQSDAIATNRLDRQQGRVYTPEPLARYTAGLVVQHLLESVSSTGEPSDADAETVRGLRVVDPACGDGELLVALWNELVLRWPTLAQGPTPIASPIDVLRGVDLDPMAARSAALRVAALDAGKGYGKRVTAVCDNALCPGSKSVHEGWASLRNRLGAPHGFDALIANPPWGASTKDYSHCLSKRDFEMFRGQVDTSDLFLELGLHLVREGGVLGYILPDSLFAVERVRVRELLATRVQMLELARLGEGFFDGVNRACSVIVVRKRRPDPEDKVRCFRLIPMERRRALAGELALLNAHEANAHLVPQARFRGNPDYRFNIDLREGQGSTANRLSELDARVGDYLVGTRGVELSKLGRIVQCSSCGLWRPRPRSLSDSVCSHCGERWSDDVEGRTIIGPLASQAGSRPLIAGEDVVRYQAIPTRAIVTGFSGINYKPLDVYRPPKLLVRKTGVGITAAMDYSNAMVTQVVYIFRQKPVALGMPLELFAGILNSRIAYYFLLVTYGEAEWRSHPYVTQKHILDFPMPTASVLASKRSAVREVADAVTLMSSGTSHRDPQIDARVEALVAELYGLEDSDMARVFELLASVEQLLPVRRLRSITLDQVLGS